MRGAVLWDMDGTLVDSEPLHDRALVAALASLGIDAPDEFHSLIVGRAAEEIHAWCCDHLGLTLPLQDWLTLKYRTYFASLDELQRRERAVELFVKVEMSGVPQAIVSNSDRLIVAANMDVAGLAVPLRTSVSRNDVRHGKPNPEGYLRAAWLLDVEPGDCIVVEDSATGAASGIAAGMRTLFWPQSEQPTPAGTERIDDMAGLEAALSVRCSP